MSAADAPTFVDFVPMILAGGYLEVYVNPDHVVTICERVPGVPGESIVTLVEYGTLAVQGSPAEVAARLRGEAL